MPGDAHDDIPTGPPAPPVAAPPAAPPQQSTYATLSLIFGILAFFLLLSGFAMSSFLVPASFVFAILAIVFGEMGRRETTPPGVMLGRGLAIAGLVLGIVYLGGWFVVPFLFFIICLMMGVSAPNCTINNTQQGGGSQNGGGGGCCCDDCSSSCDSCCTPCASCDCDCDCGGCGSACDCGCGDCGGCGGCACATAAGGPLVAAHVAQAPLPPLLSPAAARWDRALAHHPRTAAYAQDTYLVRGVRLCIGCFTTYPVFLVATALLLALAPSFPWWAFLAAGTPLALAQGVSSLGLAKRRSLKASVKTMLGLGLALLLHGTQVSPWSKPLQVAFLGALIALAMASTIPRALRMKRTCPECGAAATGRAV